MKVDLTKVQQLIDGGETLKTVADRLTADGGEGAIDPSSIGKAIKRGTISKRLARAISKAFRIPMQKLRSVA